METIGISDSKECTQCYEVKPLTEFHSAGRKDRHGNPAKKGYCKTCSKKYDSHKNPRKKSNYLSFNKRRAERYKSDEAYREKIKLERREWRRRKKTSSMVSSAKNRAREMNYAFDITAADITIPEYCPILGIKINLDEDRIRGVDSPSLDRIDNTKGYTKDNVAVISDLANIMKNRATLQQLETFIKNIPAYLARVGYQIPEN